MLVVPHESIFQQDGLYASQKFGTGVTGCLVAMVTSDVLLGTDFYPSLTAAPGTPFHRAGWRSTRKYTVDDPGTNLVGLERDGNLCLVYLEQPVYVDDLGCIVQHEHVTARVECMDGSQGECPVEMECE